MTIHETKSGYVELLCKWGHGVAADRSYYQMPAVITTDDGDGHYAAWAVRGTFRDAAETLGRLLVGDDCDHVATFEGSSVHLVRTPEGFWVELDDGANVKPDLEKYPDVVAC